MPLLIEDFVNREEQLATLWKMIRLEVVKRILLIRGRSGVGKTYLLDEFKEECGAKKIECARIDFAEGSNDYWAIALEVAGQLGLENFEHLAQTIKETYSHGLSETVPGSPVTARVEHSGADTAPTGGRSGGVDIYGTATIGRDLVGRDVYYYFITQIQRDAPVVQQEIQAEITAVFQKCLVELTATRGVVFLLDSWEYAPTDTRNWLCHNLLKWILDKKLSKAMAVVAGREVPDLRGPRPRIECLTLAELPEDAVRIYWVEKRGLPAKDVQDLIKRFRSNPLLLALMADMRLVS